MTYNAYVIKRVEDEISKYGSLRAMANAISVDPAIISKVKNGKYIPKQKTFLKWFPDTKDIIPTLTNELIIERLTIIEPKDMVELRAQLKSIGYEIIIKKIGS